MNIYAVAYHAKPQTAEAEKDTVNRMLPINSSALHEHGATRQSFASLTPINPTFSVYTIES